MYISLLASVVSWLACLPWEARFVGSNSAEDDGFLRVIKIRSTTSFGGEVKPSTPCRKILRHVSINKKFCQEQTDRQPFWSDGGHL
jgi:hypothetical protein